MTLAAAGALLLAIATVLSGCAAPQERPGDITLVPEAASASASTQSSSASEASSTGLQYSSVNVVRTKPGCQGELCPSITLKRLSFQGYERFNAFLERSLLGLALVDPGQDKTKTFRSLADLANAFWTTAEDRYEIVLGAEVKRATPSIVVIALQSYAFTGGAHGMSTMQYINWTPSFDRILTLNDLILPGRMRAFEAALKKQHAKWLETNEFAQSDKSEYVKMWPFQFSDNAALMQDGIAVTFDHYVLGPYALGMPTIVVPFSELKGIINSGLLKKLKIQG